MAKTTGKTVKAPAPQVMTAMPSEIALQGQIFKVSEATSEAEIVTRDGMAGMTLEFDFVHFKKLSDSFVATLKPASQKAYWLSLAEFEGRVRQTNIALHSIGVDPMSKILDRPRGRSNPLVRDTEKLQKLLKGWHVTSKVQGGEGDFVGCEELGFRVLRRPADKEEEKTKSPLEWTGEIWRLRDGTADPTSGEEIYNVMVCIRQQVWDDNLKAMSMASHNQYRQNKQQFFEGAENISRDMLGGKEKVIVSDLDEMHVEEHYDHGKRVG